MTEVTLPAKFDETQPLQPTGAWVRDPEVEAMDLSAAKQFIRDLGLHAPSDIPSVARMQQQDIETIAKASIAEQQKKAKKTLPWQKAQLELMNLRAREEAKRLYVIESTTADLSLFNSINLDEAFALPEEPVQWRIKNLLMVGHITTVTAPAKAGKTVFQVNRVKSYVDGNPLFGHFQVGKQVTEGNVGVWNYELNASQMHEWFRKKGIVNRHKIHVINARGADLFIQNDLVLERAIKWANDNDIRILEIDPLQAAFKGSVTSDEDAGSYINALQRLQKETGIEDIILTTHMGHGAGKDASFERTIGSARWEGFADNMIIYKRDLVTGISYLRIDKGRMPSVEEFGLSCDEPTWTLNYLGDQSGNEAKKRNEFFRKVVTNLYSGDPILKATLKEVNGTSTANKTKVNKLIAEMVDQGIVTEESVKQPSGQNALMVTMNETGCRLYSNMIAERGEISPPTAEEIAKASQGG